MTETRAHPLIARHDSETAIRSNVRPAVDGDRVDGIVHVIFPQSGVACPRFGRR